MNNPLHIHSPLLESHTLSAQSGKNIWLKFDALQPSGSFKIRGVGLACETYAKQGAKHFVSSSGGNAGIAVAYAGRKLGIPVTVVVPETTTRHAINLIKKEKAELIVKGRVWQEANEHAQSIMGEHDFFIHPFDDPLLWQGHASIIDEIVSSRCRPDAIVLSIGGGGLLSGVMQGLSRHSWEHIPVVAVETKGADSFAQSMLAAKHVALPSITSIATSLGASKVSKQAYEYSQERPIQSVVVTDLQATRACKQFLHDHRVLVEPACGASLATIYDLVPQLHDFKTVLVIVCGGVTATIEQLQQWHNSLESE